jgi:hypothetical protein
VILRYPRKRLMSFRSCAAAMASFRRVSWHTSSSSANSLDRISLVCLSGFPKGVPDTAWEIKLSDVEMTGITVDAGGVIALDVAMTGQSTSWSDQRELL